MPDRLVLQGVEPFPASRSFYREVERRLLGHPAVRAAAVTNAVPASGNGFPFAVRTESTQTAEIGDLPRAELRTASPHFLEAAGVRLERGRFFTEADDSGAATVVVVNASLAERLWPGRDPLGRLLSLCRVQNCTCSEQAGVVGVIADVRQAAADREALDQIYQPTLQSGWTGQDFLIRTVGDPKPLASELKALVQEADPTLWGVEATDVLTWVAVAATLLTVSAVACWIPALRATRIDPVVTFRGD